MKRIRLLVTLLFVSQLSLNVWAENPYGVPDDIDATLREGFHALFNLEFDKAEGKIASVQERSDKHPMVALAAAVVPWWKLTVQVLERDDAASRPFVEASERCLKLSEARLKTDKQAEARVALGTMLGLMSRWSAANRAWLPAWSRGKKSAAHLDRALEKNPKAADAYMTLGTFNYARALISRRMKGEADNGDDEAREEGLRQLRKAYTEATYFRLAAGLLLAGLLTNETPAEALPLLAELREQLPRSAFVHMVLITALYNVGDTERLQAEADSLLTKATNGEYDPSFLPQAHFAHGLVHFRKGKWRSAEKAFRETQTAGDETNPYTTWARLYQGYCFDAMGRRERAKTCYRKVLDLKPRFASHEHAKNRLDKPFSKKDPELKKLEL